MRRLWTLLLVLSSCAATGGERRAIPAPGALGPYSSAVLAGGFCFVSGKIGERGGTFEAEVESALDGVEAALAQAGLGLADLVSVTVYLTDMQRYEELNAVYARRVPAPHPARACIAVRELPGQARVEVVAVARCR